MAWATPPTAVTGTIIPASDINTIRDCLNETAPAKVTTQGDTVYATAANALARLAKGTAAQALVMNAGATAPAWAEVLPWIVDVDVLITPNAQTNWSTINIGSYTHGALKQSSGAQNAEISWSVVLAAGTWTFYLLHTTTANAGIYSVQIDAVEKGTIDGYSAEIVAGVTGSVAAIAIATTGKYTLKLVMATKNGSSSSYTGNLEHVRMLRTA